jgi:hypothetical protein
VFYAQPPVRVALPLASVAFSFPFLKKYRPEAEKHQTTLKPKQKIAKRAKKCFTQDRIRAKSNLRKAGSH